MNHNDQAAKMEEEMPHQNGVSATEKPSSESKNEIIPLSPRRTRLCDELLNKIVPWEKITVSLDNFPYYIDEHTKAHLMECVASHLKHSKLRKYRGHLKSSSERILLQSIPGTNLYRERLVSALAREFQVPLLKLDDLAYEGEKDDSDDEVYAGEEDDSDDESDAKAKTEVCRLKKGNRVKYVGKAILIEETNNRTLSSGQRGEVCEVNGERVAVAFSICGLASCSSPHDNEGKLLIPHESAVPNYLAQPVSGYIDDISKHAQVEGLFGEIHLKEMELEKLNGLWRRIESGGGSDINLARNRFGRSNSYQDSLSSEYSIDPRHKLPIHIGGRNESLQRLMLLRNSGLGNKKGGRRGR